MKKRKKGKGPHLYFLLRGEEKKGKGPGLPKVTKTMGIEGKGGITGPPRMSKVTIITPKWKKKKEEREKRWPGPHHLTAPRRKDPGGVGRGKKNLPFKQSPERGGDQKGWMVSKPLKKKNISSLPRGDGSRGISIINNNT